MRRNLKYTYNFLYIQVFIMSKLNSMKEVLKLTWESMMEDFQQMDHKLIRIGVGVAVFLVWAYFWFFFFQSSSPFPF